jgi:metallo-beta-lactamase family protein
MFSGDIGAGNSAFIGDPEGPQGFDHVVMESTYGHATRPPLDAAARQAALAGELSQARAAGGPLLIPAFAVERTQELVVDLMDLMATNRAPPGPIYVDSPLAVEVSKAFLEHGDDGKGQNRFQQLHESGQLHFTEAPEQSKAIANVKGWHVILSASGMCDAGRVRHHLKRLLWRPEASVMLVGYQAVGTLGRLLRDGQREVRIQGEPITVKARIRNLDVYSGHADVNGLTAWAKARSPIRGSVFLTHGENDSRDNLETALKAAGIANGNIIAPILDQTFSLIPGKSALPVAGEAPRIAPHAPARLDWSNKRAQFLSDLESHLRAAQDDNARELLLASLSKQLSSAQ